MLDLKVCTVCFSTDVKLFSMNNGNLRHEFNLVSGLQSYLGNGMPEYLCVVCTAYVRRCMKFRDKCQRAQYALQELLRQNKEIKKSCLKAFDRESIDIAPILSYINLEKSHYEQVKFQWVKHNRLNVAERDAIPVAHYSTSIKTDSFQVPALDHVNGNNVKVEDEAETYDETAAFDDIATKVEDLFTQSTSNIQDIQVPIENDFIDHDDNFSDNDGVPEVEDTDERKMDKQKVDGTDLDVEYASLYPISKREAKAAVEVYKLFTNGKFKCEVCNKSYNNELRMKTHLRMHDKHISGMFNCDICNYYYKTDFLLKTHMTEKHMYKYVCRKCPEVSFDRTSAKQHYIWNHLQNGRKKHANWYETRPKWLNTRGGKRVKGVVTLRPVRKLPKLPEDFLVYTPISQDEQYKIVLERQNSKNYTESSFKCEMCFRGFREMATYSKHMKKHDPAISGKLQCDMCKLYFRDHRKMYKHMNITHLFKYTCQDCSFVCYNKGQAQMHYRFHKNVKYPCPHCDKEFIKASTQLTHIRMKHPSTNICDLCGHSFVSDNGLYCHKQIAHTEEERHLSATTVFDSTDPWYCAECGVHFLSNDAFVTHLGSSNKHATTNLSSKPHRRKCLTGEGGGGGGPAAGGSGKRRGRPPRCVRTDVINNGASTATTCELCGKFLVNDVKARKHYTVEHPGADYLKRYMCDVCGHTTRQYANLMVHMRTHTNEKPYECPHCDRRFSMPSNRDRHLVVHTGEKRYQCQHCNRRFTQSSAVKLHIQTVHLKIPYAPWDKKNRKRRKELEGTSAPVSAVSAVTNCLQQPHKLVLDTQGDYLNAYITYNDD